MQGAARPIISTYHPRDPPLSRPCWEPRPRLFRRGDKLSCMRPICWRLMTSFFQSLWGFSLIVIVMHDWIQSTLSWICCLFLYLIRNFGRHGNVRIIATFHFVSSEVSISTLISQCVEILVCYPLSYFWEPSFSMTMHMSSSIWALLPIMSLSTR